MITSWPVWRIETEKRRLEILRYLAHAPAYQASASLLRLHCSHIGVPTTDDQMHHALGWLEEHELMTHRVAGEEIVARLTSMGRDVAEGARTVAGVLRPDP